MTYHETGCYIDGALGNDHARSSLARMLEYHQEAIRAQTQEDGNSCPVLSQVIDTLHGPMSDDDWETDEATEMLQSITEEGLVWEWSAGDLCLVEESA